MQRAPIKIAFRYYYAGHSLELFRRDHPYLLPHYEFEVSNDPDVCFFSVFDGSWFHTREPVHMSPTLTQALPRARTVFYTAENVLPVMMDCDFAITFERDVADVRHYRLPHFVHVLYRNGLSPSALIKSDSTRPTAKRRRFCAFIQDHDVEFRTQFVKRLSKYKKVDCPGKCLNNMKSDIGRLTPDVLSFLSQYKFAVTFENCSTDGSAGYVTEKLPNAMAAGCLPIYWGDKRVHEDFNPKSFVNFHDYGDVDAVIDRIIELDEEVDCFEATAREPWFHGNELPAWLQEDRILAFFHRLFAGLG